MTVDKYKVKKQAYNVFISICRYLFLLIVGYVVLYPLIYMVSNAIKSYDDLLNVTRIWLPAYRTFDNFKEIWEWAGFEGGFVKTFALQITSAFVEVMMCAFAGYGLARFDFKLKKLESALLILALLVPVQMYSLALAITYRYLGIFNTSLVYWLPSIFGVGIRGGMIIFIYRQFFAGLPKELEEAAYVDGAGSVKTFFTIALPSSGVVILTVSVLSFIWHWNENYIADLCLVSENRPLASVMGLVNNFLQMQGIFSGKPEYPVHVCAACVMFIIVPLVLYMIFQRKFVRSIDRVGITG